MIVCLGAMFFYAFQACELQMWMLDGNIFQEQKILISLKTISLLCFHIVMDLPIFSFLERDLGLTHAINFEIS